MLIKSLCRLLIVLYGFFVVRLKLTVIDRILLKIVHLVNTDTSLKLCARASLAHNC